MFSVIFIFILFSILLALVWLWFYNNEKLSIPNTDKILEKVLKDGDYKSAKDSLEKIIKSFPKDFNALFCMAQILQKEKNPDAALEFYNKAVEENDKSFDSYLNIGKIHFDKRDYAKAIEAFEKAKELSSENVETLFWVTKCKNQLSNLDNEEENQQIIDEYLNISKNSNAPKEISISLAKMYAQKGEINEAFGYCRKALEDNEQDVDAYKLMGLIQLINKDVEGAKSTLAVALNFQPNNMEVHEIFSYVLCQLDDDRSIKKCREKYYELIKKHIDSD